jgi:periplasmic divalent cation tolerance protein
MSDANDLAMVITTVATAQEAETVASALIDQSLAACVQLDGPITSLYRWAGKVEKSTEFRLMIKTSRTAWPTLREKLASLHSYEEPEIILVAIDDVSEGYRRWVIDQTS